MFKFFNNKNLISFFLFFAEFSSLYYETDETAKQKMLADLKRETLPFYLDRLDATAKQNNGYLTLGRVCVYFCRPYHPIYRV